MVTSAAAKLSCVSKDDHIPFSAVPLVSRLEATLAVPVLRTDVCKVSVVTLVVEVVVV